MRSIVETPRDCCNGSFPTPTRQNKNRGHVSRRTRHQITAAITVLLCLAASYGVSAEPLPPSTAAAGVVIMRPERGERANSFDLTLPAGASCPSTASVWQTFIIPLDRDPSQLRYEAGQPSIEGSTDRMQPLMSAGRPVVDQPVGAGGAISTARYFQFSDYAAGVLTTGQYRLGIACTDAAGDTRRFWATTTSIDTDGTGVSGWAPYGPPPAPVLGQPRFGVLGAFTAKVTLANSSPPTTSVRVTATPADVGGAAGSVVIDQPATGSPIEVTVDGLTNGIRYTLSAVATNALGDSPASNALSGLIYDANQLVGVGQLVATQDSRTATLSWAPPTEGTVIGYVVTVDPTVAGAPFTTTATSITINDLEPGPTTFTVTPTMAPPYVGLPTALTTSVAGPGQSVEVVRPRGVLALTQTCGRFGALPAEQASPGFPDLPALGATGTGRAPTIDREGMTPDPGFAQYPNPSNGPGNGANYPTYCTIDLGTPELVTEGPESGKYLATWGRLNQVTVFDTRPLDLGWTISADTSDFTNGSARFGGTFLGWTPATKSVGGAAYDGYQQVISPGAPTLPDAVGSRSVTLGTAPAGSGIGVAHIDARLRLLVPLTAQAGTFHATVTITVV